MKTALTTILTICLFAPQVIAGNTVEKQYCINADFLYNYDGDSLTATFPQLANALGKDIDPAGILWYKAKIRVLGIDTPEKRGKCKAEKKLANIAKEFVKTRLAKAKSFKLCNFVRGKYFRLVGNVIYTDTNGIEADLSQELIEADLAVPYDGGRKTKTWCE
ncbi:MAG: thermonuclease family protein [Myxococcota bacterium]|nr:thermonuclease family protein [Myxococcota bacterium]